MNLVNITGFNSSGASAVRDYLTEFENIEVFPNEFKLFRIKDGIFDLFDSLFEKQLFPVERDISVKNFIIAMEKLEKFSVLTRLGMKVGNMLPENFRQILGVFISSIKESEYYGHSYQLEMEIPYFNRKFGLIFQKFNSLLYKITKLDKIDRKNNQKIGIYTQSFEKFKLELQYFIGELFESAYTFKVLLDATPPNIKSITVLHRLFLSTKTIVLVRDPRDVYVTAIKKDQSWFVGDINRSDNDPVKNFINHYSTNLRHFQSLEDSQDVLVIYFEELVLNYTHVASIINTFLNLKNSINKYKYFNPTESVKTIGIYKKWSNKDDILRIERDLNMIYPHLNRYL